MNSIDAKPLEYGGTAASQTLQVAFYYDFLCPWCWIGLRNLQRALAQLKAEAPALNVAWRSVSHQLLPNVPAEGLPYEAFYLARLGSAEAVAARRAQVVAAAQAAGLQLNHAAITRLPNTRLAHRLANAAQTGLTPEQHVALLDAVFAAYFQQGVDIGDQQALATLARDKGVPDDAVQVAWGPAHQLNPQPHPVQGVPHVVFNGWQAVSGAQPTEVWLKLMRQMLSEQGNA